MCVMPMCVIYPFLEDKRHIYIVYTLYTPVITVNNEIDLSVYMVSTNLISQILHDVCDNLVSVQKDGR